MRVISQVIADQMKKCNINYSKGKKRGKITYPYFVGQIYLLDSGDESGKQEYELLLDGFDRDPDESKFLEDIETIEKAFPAIGGYVFQDRKNLIMISYDTMIPDIPTDPDVDLNRAQIKLKITKWRC
ncbi:MAG: hypothetical protein HFI48_05725 [Lachnospiraceae bacterium]|nr:hypothetical protein [Lachnospiraceae bacterium]